jgi:uncharacterized membrane protein (UPF0127 family)
MTFWKFGQSFVFVAALVSGCGNADKLESASAPAAVSSASAAKTNAPALGVPSVKSQPYPTEAQPTLRTIKLWIGAEELITELAMSRKEIETGMMHRSSMGENEGMLFVFAGPQQIGFWMKNTLLPLSCAYIDPDGVILEIHDMYPLDEKPIVAKTDRIQYVLETKQGWFQRHKVGVGAIIRTERGSLAETFVRSPR